MHQHAATVPVAPAVTEMDRYLFDLNGYLIIRGALTPAQVAACNATYDEIEETAKSISGKGWWGDVSVTNNGRQEGIGLQQLYEAGPVWEELLDHPAWYDKCIHFVGTDDPENFDTDQGPAFIDECFGTIRPQGGAQRLHSGGDVGAIRCQFRYHAGKFHCGQVNILMAFTDIGPGDGATMVIPGSHKSNIRHPQTVPIENYADEVGVDGITGAVECHLEKGDVLLFVDAIAHGSARRTNPGNRRVAVYRYGPSWGSFRLPFRPSPELLARLTPRRRGLVMPHGPAILPPGRTA